MYNDETGEYEARSYSDTEEYTIRCPRCGKDDAEVTITTDTHYFSCGCCSESSETYIVTCSACGEYEPEYTEREAIPY